MPAATRKANSKTGQVLIFEMERETKNTVRFAELTAKESDEPMVGVLYIKKTLFDKLGKPEALEVTIKADEGSEE